LIAIERFDRRTLEDGIFRGVVVWGRDVFVRQLWQIIFFDGGGMAAERCRDGRRFHATNEHEG
jgi:hypothetical protein